jgi:hypothetical protein
LILRVRISKESHSKRTRTGASERTALRIKIDMVPNTKADAVSTSAVGVLHNKLVSNRRVEVLARGSISANQLDLISARESGNYGDL